MFDTKVIISSMDLVVSHVSRHFPYSRHLVGRLEYCKVGRLEGWNVRRLEGWKFSTDVKGLVMMMMISMISMI